jgi:GTP-binding protein
LIGLRTELLNETQGTAHVRTTFHEYQKYMGPMKKNPKGAIVNMADGMTTSYALKEVEKFGMLFVRAGQKVYNGLVIGENNKE